MNGCFVLYPFELGETLTKRINVGVSTDNSFGRELAEDVVCMEDIPPYDVSLRDGWAISTTEGNHTLVGEPVKNGEQPALLQKTVPDGSIPAVFSRLLPMPSFQILIHKPRILLLMCIPTRTSCRAGQNGPKGLLF